MKEIKKSLTNEEVFTQCQNSSVGRGQISLGRAFHNLRAMTKSSSQVAICLTSKDGTQSSASEHNHNGWIGPYGSRQSLRYAHPELYRVPELAHRNILGDSWTNTEETNSGGIPVSNLAASFYPN